MLAYFTNSNFLVMRFHKLNQIFNVFNSFSLTDFVSFLLISPTKCLALSKLTPNFPRKFAFSSLYIKARGLWVHSTLALREKSPHLEFFWSFCSNAGKHETYKKIQLCYKKSKFQPQINILFGNCDTFSVKHNVA